MTDREESTAPRLGQVKDLSAELNQHAHRLTESVLGIVRTLMYDARYADALQLLGSDFLRLIGTETSSLDAVRVQITKASVLNLESRDSGEGRDEVMAYLEEIESAVLGCSDQGVLAEYLQVKANAVMEQELIVGRTYDAALDLLERAHALYEETGNLRGIAESLFRIGLVYDFRREDTERNKPRAAEFYERARSAAEEIGDLRTQSDAARHLGGIEQDRGDLDAALAWYEESLSLRERLGYRGTLPGAYDAIAGIHVEMGNLDLALPYIAETRRWAEETGFQRYVFLSALRTGDVLKGRGELQEAVEKYREALAIAEASSFQPGIDWTKEVLESLDS